MRALLVLTVLLAACSGGVDPASTTIPPANDDYEAVFERWVTALETSDFETAADVTIEVQIPLLALAEGLSGSQVAALTDADRVAIASNFWSGFIGQAEPMLGSPVGSLRVEDWMETVAGGTDFAVAELFRSSDASVRRVVLRDTADGWKLDLISSFPSAMINLVPDAAQVIRASGDARLLDDMRAWQPSVELVIAETTEDPLLNQAGLSALEAIIR